MTDKTITPQMGMTGNTITRVVDLLGKRVGRHIITRIEVNRGEEGGYILTAIPCQPEEVCVDVYDLLLGPKVEKKEAT